MSKKRFTNVDIDVTTVSKTGMLIDVPYKGKMVRRSDDSFGFNEEKPKKRHRTPTVFKGVFSTCHILQNGNCSITTRFDMDEIDTIKKKVLAEISCAFDTLKEYKAVGEVSNEV